MRIEAVIISVNYADYLRHTIPFNKSLFDRAVVVTTEKDKETQNICKYNNVEFICTDQFYANGAKFNKGKGINAGLKHLAFTDWCLHMDADIVLPAKTRIILEQIKLNDQFLYGIDRMMVPNAEYWEKFLQNPHQQHEFSYVHPGPFPFGTRIMKLDQGGYIPLGFFQLFNRRAKVLVKEPIYPEEWGTAASSDMHFAYKFPRDCRHLLPEIIGTHLSTDDISNSPMSINWSGRKTSPFKFKEVFDVVSKRAGSVVLDEK